MSQRITNQTVHNPQMLRKVLEAMDTELDNVRTLINELRTDHAGFKSLGSSLRRWLGELCLSSAGLTIGSVSKKEVLIANTTYYLINGVIKSKATAEIPFTATTHDIAAGSTAYFTYSIQDDGTVTVTKTTDNPMITATTAPTSDEAIIGVVKIVATGTPFDATTDDLDAAHLAVTYYNTGFLLPLISTVPETISAAAITEQVEHGS